VGTKLRLSEHNTKKKGFFLLLLSSDSNFERSSTVVKAEHNTKQNKKKKLGKICTSGEKCVPLPTKLKSNIFINNLTLITNEKTFLLDDGRHPSLRQCIYSMF
jgi:hypothetical protein